MRTPRTVKKSKHLHQRPAEELDLVEREFTGSESSSSYSLLRNRMGNLKMSDGSVPSNLMDEPKRRIVLKARRPTRNLRKKW